MKTKKGFSLIETILYATLVSIVSVFVVGSILMMMKVSANIRLGRNLNVSARTAMERMIREIRLADSIDGSSASNYLKLNTIDTGGAPTTIDFFLNGTNLMVQEGTAPPENLTSSNVAVESLLFNQILTSATSKAVKIEMEINSQKFYDTAVLRRSY